ncbi:MAG TPA: type III polyketide synthase [Kiloniellales bacterium]|nr:type III polyketide synthase [Kiloniellales bacterium]
MRRSRQPEAKLLSLATAVPPHALSQRAIQAAAAELFAEEHLPVPRLQRIYQNAGIENRYGALPLQQLATARSWRTWHDIFRPAALSLLEEVARQALDRAGLEAAEVDTLLIACSTGFSVPSLDALLLDRLPFRRTVERVPLVGYGCAGGILGLSRAAALTRARPHSVALFLTVELCTLTFRPHDRSRTNQIATALFGDGAAAAVISSGDSSAAPALTASGEYCWPESEEIMGWSVKDDGLAVRLSPGLPDLIRRDGRRVVQLFLTEQQLSFADIDHWVLHPGGAKVLTALRECLSVSDAELEPARRVLRANGNMSAPTVLFVLEDILTAGTTGRLLCLAFGPGFTGAYLLLDADRPWPPTG